MTATNRTNPGGDPVALRAPKHLPLIYLAVFGGYTGQQILTPVLPPLARELSLSEFQLGLVLSASAVVVALISPVWGRCSDVWSRKSLLAGSLFGAAAGLLAFAVSAQTGISGLLATPVVFGLLLLTRGVLFGGALAALPVAAQSYVADVTPDEPTRIRGIARTGASLGLALVLGPGLGGVLGDFGLWVPLYVAPAVLTVVFLVVLFRLPREPRHVERRNPPRLHPFDRRVRSFLLVGLGIYLSISLLQLSIGFLIQDRLHLDGARTAAITGLVLLVGGLPMLLIQGLVVPKLGWSPVQLMRVGLPLAATGFALIIFVHNLPEILVAVMLSGLGHSLTVPGYTAAPSLSVGADQQGGAAALITSTNAVTLIVGPLVATALYQVGSGLPFVVGALVLGCLFVFLLVNRRMRTWSSQS